MRIRVAGLLIKKNKLLVLKYCYNGTTVYALPGGNHESAESLQNTLIREFQEELNLSISVVDLNLVVETLTMDKKRTLHMIFGVNTKDHEPKINPIYTTCLGFEWIDMDEIRGLNLYPNVTKLLAENHKEKKIYYGNVEQMWF
jgi:ADP-ribose pyrophosphatase YjhB (NUDIX family)